MPYQTLDLKPVDRITADAIGKPGERVFYLQARQGNRLVTVICEKEHVAALAQKVDRVLLSRAGDDPDGGSRFRRDHRTHCHRGGPDPERSEKPLVAVPPLQP